MQKIYSNACRIAPLFLLSILSNINILHAQFGALNRVLGTVNNVAGTANRVAYTVASFENLAESIDEMSAEEYDNSVHVSKGRSTNFKYDEEDVSVPEYRNGKFIGIQWEPITYFDKHLFASTIVSMATYTKKTKGLLSAISRPIGFRIVGDESNVLLYWELSCEGDRYFSKTNGTVLYRDAGEPMELMPVLPWDYDMLIHQEATTPFTVTFRIHDNKGHEVKKIQALKMRSINDCIYGYKEISLDYLVAAYIQEEHPEIDKILKEALNTKMITAVSGYNCSKEETTMQVAAIWRVLNQRGFQYSSISRVASFNPDITSQSIRTFEKAVSSRQANCIDGSIVLASVLRKIGISTVLILTADHCFIGYYTDKTKKEVIYLETTKLSNSSLVNKAKTKAQKTDAYLQQFQLAMDKGYEEYQSSKNDKSFVKIDIDEMRKKVSPIPFSKDYGRSPSASKKPMSLNKANLKK
jgi:hypothetical protein